MRPNVRTWTWLVSAKNHADPRWAAFLRKIGYAPEQLAKIEFKVMLPDGGPASGPAHP
jgi:hypothetical protein